MVKKGDDDDVVWVKQVIMIMMMNRIKIDENDILWMEMMMMIMKKMNIAKQ